MDFNKKSTQRPIKCYSGKTDFISFNPRKQKNHPIKSNGSFGKKRYTLTHAFMELSVSHNIDQTATTSKACIPCFLVIMIN